MSLEFSGVSCRYLSSPRLALREISFTVPTGTCWGLLGRGGAGKTTLGYLAAGIIPHIIEAGISGRVIADSLDLTAASYSEIVGRVGIVLQDPWAQLSGVKSTVADEVAFGLENLGVSRGDMEARVGSSLRRLGIEHLATRSPDELSGGQVQRVAFASILAMRPSLMVLDEPTAQLDPEGVEIVAGILESATRDSTALLISHDRRDLARICDGVAVLDQGCLVANERIAERPAAGQMAHQHADAESTASPDAYAGSAASCELNNAFQITLPSTRQAPSVVFDDVSFEYSNRTRALNAISLSVVPGSRVALVGRNGAGKTTLARHVIGLLKPSRGNVWVGDWNTRGLPPERMAERVGFLFQNPADQLFCRSVRAEVAFGPHALGFDVALAERLSQWALTSVGFQHLANAHPLDLAFSERRLVALASVLATDPAVLVLDEPTAGLDEESVTWLGDLIQTFGAAGRTVIAISHDMRFCAKYFDRMLVLDQGRVSADGSPISILTNEALCKSSGLRHLRSYSPMALRDAANL